MAMTAPPIRSGNVRVSYAGIPGTARTWVPKPVHCPTPTCVT